MDLSEKKVVFFDIDGTLVDGATHQIPKSAIEGIRRLRARGNLAFLNTGRTIVSIGKEIKEIGFDGYICGCGTRIYLEDKEIFVRTIAPKTCGDIVKALRKFRVPGFFESPNAVYFDPANPANGDQVEQSRQDFTAMGSHILDIPKEFFAEEIWFDKFYCMCTQESDLEGVKELIAEYKAVTHGSCYYEVMPKGCSKSEGIRFLQRKLGIRLENCYAMGDSANDIEMLEAVSAGIAMGDCAPDLLPHSSYHTTKVTEDGVYRALEHYGLI